MQSSMQQQPVQPQHYPGEAYRGTPNGQGPTALPPIHHFEGMQPQQQYAAINGAQLQHPQPYNPNQYQYQTNGAMQPAPMPSNGQNGVLRFPIAPQAPLDARSMSGGRHKKEIKRRTKTGCLTCRKRRIKCDEGHPTCRNCTKSKRECLGYDPIFKQQPGPAAIQPAPATSTTPSSKPSTTPNDSYQTFQGTGGTFVPAPATTSYSGIDASVAYNTSVDPALSRNDQAALEMAQGYPSQLRSDRRVKPVNMDQLFSLNGIPPPYQKREAPPPISNAIRQEAVDFYTFHYAPGLDKLLETTYYSQRGATHLQSDPLLLDFVAQCAEHFKTQNTDYNATQARPSLEARLVWHLACMPRNESQFGANGTSSESTTREILPRIDTLEHLLTGQYLDRAKIPAAAQAADNAKYNEQAFWHQLGQFTSLHDDSGDRGSLQAINDSLGAMRGILSMLENRDVLYSVAVARHIGGRMADWNPSRVLQPIGTDQSSDVDKLLVAHGFVHTEDQRGTNQVIQRICGMSLRSWVLQKTQ